MNFLAVFIGGGLGSIARYSISLLIPKNVTNFPIATFISNLAACIILALLVKHVKPSGYDEKVMLLAAVGFCGGFSTFSTFSLENIELIKSGFTSIAITNALISVLVCGVIMHFLLNK